MGGGLAELMTDEVSICRQPQKKFKKKNWVHDDYEKSKLFVLQEMPCKCLHFVKTLGIVFVLQEDTRACFWLH
jgi:hypothetical protein